MSAEEQSQNDVQQRALALTLARSLRQRILEGAGSESEESLVNDLLKLDCPMSMRYSYIHNAEQIISLNCMERDDLSHVAACIRILKKYASNLLRPEQDRPRGWRSINRDNRTYINKVECVKGSQSLLTAMGYHMSSSIDTPHFPLHSEPDPVTVAGVFADLLQLHADLTRYDNGTHPHPHHIQTLIARQQHQAPANLLETPPPTANNPMVGALMGTSDSPACGPSGDNSGPQSQGDVSGCDICGGDVEWRCPTCEGKMYCAQCDRQWHRHSLRNHHQRQHIQHSAPAATHQSTHPRGQVLAQPPANPEHDLQQQVILEEQRNRMLMVQLQQQQQQREDEEENAEQAETFALQPQVQQPHGQYGQQHQQQQQQQQYQQLQQQQQQQQQQYQQQEQQQPQQYLPEPPPQNVIHPQQALQQQWPAAGTFSQPQEYGQQPHIGTPTWGSQLQQGNARHPPLSDSQRSSQSAHSEPHLPESRQHGDIPEKMPEAMKNPVISEGSVPDFAHLGVSNSSGSEQDRASLQSSQFGEDSDDDEEEFHLASEDLPSDEDEGFAERSFPNQAPVHAPDQVQGQPNQAQGQPIQVQGQPNQAQGQPNQAQGQPNQAQGHSNHAAHLPAFSDASSQPPQHSSVLQQGARQSVEVPIVTAPQAQLTLQPPAPLSPSPNTGETNSDFRPQMSPNRLHPNLHLDIPDPLSEREMLLQPGKKTAGSGKSSSARLANVSGPPSDVYIPDPVTQPQVEASRQETLPFEVKGVQLKGPGSPYQSPVSKHAPLTPSPLSNEGQSKFRESLTGTSSPLTTQPPSQFRNSVSSTPSPLTGHAPKPRSGSGSSGSSVSGTPSPGIRKYASMMPGSGSQSFGMYNEDWLCEHCTLKNEAGTRVCAECCKTSNRPLAAIPELNLLTPEPGSEERMEPARKSSLGTNSDSYISHHALTMQEEAEKIIRDKNQAKADEEMARQMERMDLQEGGGAIMGGATMGGATVGGGAVGGAAVGGATGSGPSGRGSSHWSSSSAANTEEHRQKQRQQEEELRRQREQYRLEKAREEAAMEGRLLVRAMQAAERNGHTTEEIDLALKVLSDSTSDADPDPDPSPDHGAEPVSVSPLERWLAREFVRVVDRTVATVQETYGVSVHADNARAAVLACGVDVPKAAQHCAESRRKKEKEVKQQYRLSNDQLKERLTAHGHNLDAVVDLLNEDIIRTLLHNTCSPDSLDHAAASASPDDATSTSLDVGGGGDVRPKVTSVAGGGAGAGDNGREVSVGTSAFIEDDVIVRQLKDPTVPYQRRERIVMGELGMGVERAKNVLKLVDSVLGENVQLSDIIEAVRSHGNLTRSRSYLQQECETCFEKYPARMIQILAGFCNCKVCTACLKQHFEVCIREKHVSDMKCPVCGSPEDLEDEEVATRYFSYLNLLLQHNLSAREYGLMQDKVTNWHIMRQDNFYWCSYDDCDEGFLFEAHGDSLKMTCQKCHRATCIKCKKPWEDVHENMSCEEFSEWRQLNDPAYQEAGLAAHLQEHGIVCPSCQQRFSLARGGCLHFTCTTCKHEFCGGCKQPFKSQTTCNELPSCSRSGIHCHHPRNCLYYIRDYDVAQLQILLQNNEVTYKVEVEGGSSMGSEDGASAAGASGGASRGASRTTCSVMEQKERPEGLRDDRCGKEVMPGHAGLCEVHYKEYLVTEINRARIDPVSIMTLHEIERVVSRQGIQWERRARDTDSQHKNELLKIIAEQIPLP